MVAVVRDAHVGKKAGGVKALERLIESGVIETPLDPLAKFGTNRRGIDVLVAGDDDRGIRQRRRLRLRAVNANQNSQRQRYGDDSGPARHEDAPWPHRWPGAIRRGRRGGSMTDCVRM